MLGSNPARDSQVRTGEWPLQAPTDLPPGLFSFIPFTCPAMPPKTRFRGSNNAGLANQAASVSILSSFSLAPFAQPCQRGMVIERASR